MIFSGNFSFQKKLADKTWNLTFIEASLAFNKAKLLPHLYNRWPKEWIAVYESQPEILRDISNSKLRILSFIIPPPDLHQRVSREPVRGSQEKGLAVDLHGRSRADVRQRIGQEPKFTACNLCVGRTRNVFRTVERYHRQFIQLQSFWSRLSHDVPLDRWDFLFVYCCWPLPEFLIWHHNLISRNRSQPVNWIQLRLQRRGYGLLAERRTTHQQSGEHRTIGAGPQA